MKRTAFKKKVKPKKPKKPSVSSLKKKTWTQFSIFIRTREADADGMTTCITCPVRAHWKSMQCGHFIRGRLNANLFEERGVAQQCYGCNIGRQGHVVVYYKVMLGRYGQEVIDELIVQNNTARKWQGGELQGLLEHYKALNARNPLVKITVDR